MGILRKFFGPGNSLVLVYDHITDEGREELASQIAQVKEFYRFAKLSEIAGAPDGKRATGLAAVVFAQARKSLFLRALPLLRGEGIPVTIFLDIDCIGMNRLPAAEELAWYRDHYPDAVPAAEADRLAALAWREPRDVEGHLRLFRKRVGPLPLDKIDPTLYFTTWGKIVEIPPNLLDLGLSLTSAPAEAAVREALHFIRQMTGRETTLAWNPRAPDGSDVLRAAGITGAVGAREGAVERATPALDLPRWPLSLEVSDEKTR